MIHIDQDLDVKELIEEIEFSWCVGLQHQGNPEKAIKLELVYDILKKYFPQINKYIDEQKEKNRNIS